MQKIEISAKSWNYVACILLTSNHMFFSRAISYKNAHVNFSDFKLLSPLKLLHLWKTDLFLFISKTWNHLITYTNWTTPNPTTICSILPMYLCKNARFWRLWHFIFVDCNVFLTFLTSAHYYERWRILKRFVFWFCDWNCFHVCTRRTPIAVAYLGSRSVLDTV